MDWHPEDLLWEEGAPVNVPNTLLWIVVTLYLPQSSPEGVGAPSRPGPPVWQGWWIQNDEAFAYSLLVAPKLTGAWKEFPLKNAAGQSEADPGGGGRQRLPVRPVKAVPHLGVPTACRFLPRPLSAIPGAGFEPGGVPWRGSRHRVGPWPSYGRGVSSPGSRACRQQEHSPGAGVTQKFPWGGLGAARVPDPVTQVWPMAPAASAISGPAEPGPHHVPSFLQAPLWAPCLAPLRAPSPWWGITVSLLLAPWAKCWGCSRDQR